MTDQEFKINRQSPWFTPVIVGKDGSPIPKLLKISAAVKELCDSGEGDDTPPTRKQPYRNWREYKP